MRFAMRRFPELVEEYKVMSWRVGRSNVVMSVHHAGTVGSDITPVGNIICQSGHVIETRKGNIEFPIKTLVGDAGTDQIAEGVRELMAQDGLELLGGHRVIQPHRRCGHRCFTVACA